jgi:hypothetical protein
MLGEKTLPLVPPQYGHPHHIQTNELRKVPWLVIDSGERRDIVEDEPVGHERLDEDIINERLETLGYVD